MLLVVCYDIPATPEGNRRRARLVKYLESFGQRKQYSVFEIPLSEKTDPEKLKRKIKQLIRPDEDQVRIYPLHEDMVRGITVLGQGEVHRIESVYII